MTARDVRRARMSLSLATGRVRLAVTKAAAGAELGFFDWQEFVTELALFEENEIVGKLADEVALHRSEYPKR